MLNQGARDMRKLREKLKLSQGELGATIGISRAYVGFLETGRKKPSRALCAKIWNSLKIPALAWDTTVRAA